MEEARLHSQ